MSYLPVMITLQVLGESKVPVIISKVGFSVLYPIPPSPLAGISTVELAGRVPATEI